MPERTLTIDGVSNVTVDQRKEQWKGACVCPRFVQNRCYAVRGWDRQARQFCKANGLVYQGFSLLTANLQTLAAPEFAQVAARHRRTIPQIVFRFALDVGMIPLTGTTDAEHLQADLAVFDFRLQPAEVAQIEDLVAG